jgi:hypothetical protein
VTKIANSLNIAPNDPKFVLRWDIILISGDKFFSFGGKFEIFVKILQVQEKYRRFKLTINEEPVQIETFCEQI